MITPRFRCTQDEAGYVTVEMVLSAQCRVGDAAFDITGKQFTFTCSPYFLRLVFEEPLTEGRGERATYDLSTQLLTVWLPKAVPTQTFGHLQSPALLLATHLQRRKLVREVAPPHPSTLPAADNAGGKRGRRMSRGGAGEGRPPAHCRVGGGGVATEGGPQGDSSSSCEPTSSDEDDAPLRREVLETEYVQVHSLPAAAGAGVDADGFFDPSALGSDARKDCVPSDGPPPDLRVPQYYGFNGQFTGVFTAMVRSASQGEVGPQDNGDAAGMLLRGVLEGPNPDDVSLADRRQLRIASENARFDAGAVYHLLFCDEPDDDPDIALLREAMQHYRPNYVVAFEEALRRGARPAGGAAAVETQTAAHADDEIDGPVCVVSDLSRRLLALAFDEAHLPTTELLHEHQAGGHQTGGQASSAVKEAWSGNVGELPRAASEVDGVPVAATTGPATRNDSGPTSSVDAKETVLPSSDGRSSTLADNIEDGTQDDGDIVPEEAFATRFDQLACCVVRPKTVLTFDQLEVLARLPPSAGSQPVSFCHFMCLTVDLLAASLYDDLVNLGEPTSESLDTIIAVSPALSWIDDPGLSNGRCRLSGNDGISQVTDAVARLLVPQAPPSASAGVSDADADLRAALYDVAKSFTRRVMSFGLLRSHALALRALRNVGIVLLSGAVATTRCLVDLKLLIDHSESRYVLNTLWLNGLLRQFQQETAARHTVLETELERVAAVLHSVVTAGASENQGALLNVASLDLPWPGPPGTNDDD